MGMCRKWYKYNLKFIGKKGIKGIKSVVSDKVKKKKVSFIFYRVKYKNWTGIMRKL